MATRSNVRKATKKDQEANAAVFAFLFGFIGCILLIPSLVLAIIYFFVLNSRYLQRPSAQRVVDTPKVFLAIGKGGGVVGSLLFCMFFFAPLIGGITSNANLAIIFMTIFAIPALLLLVIYIFRIPVLYLGIIGDPENDKLFFPCDMQSYTLGDYVIMRFIKDACSIDSINLSEINRITRGYGVDLYVHGAFGSRKITMSSKQKRDECIAMIQAFCGKKGVLASEIESY